MQIRSNFRIVLLGPPNHVITKKLPQSLYLSLLMVLQCFVSVGKVLGS